MLTEEQRAGRAGQLLDCMDGIGDVYVNQAILWRERGIRAADARRRRRRTAWITAAALCGVLMMGVIRVAVLVSWFSPSGDDRPAEPGSTSLSAYLSEAVAAGTFTPADPGTLDCFDGSVRLCVGDRHTGQVYVSRALTRDEQLLLAQEMTAGYAGRAVRGTQEDYSVWILCGNGLVVSPCLDNTPGCVGAGGLFDYADERVPTELFRRLVRSLGA